MPDQDSDDEEFSAAEEEVKIEAPSEQKLQLNVPVTSKTATSGAKSRSPSPSGQSINVDFRVASQCTRLGMLEQLAARLEKLQAKDLSEIELDGQQCALDRLWSSFEQEHDQLGAAAKKAFFRHAYMVNDVFGSGYQAYDKANTRLYRLKSEVNGRGGRTQRAQGLDMAQGVGSAHNAKLPQIQLPTFDGTFDGWAPFRDLFVSLVIDDERLSPVEKFHYLRSSVTGSAAQLIAGVPLSGDSFGSAWQLFKDRYDDKERLIMHHVGALISGSSQVGARSAQDLYKLVSTIREKLHALTALGIPVDTWNYVLIYVISARLEPSLREDWEVLRSSRAGDTSYEDLLAFVEGRARALEAAGSQKTNRPKQQSTTSQNKSGYGKSGHRPPERKAAYVAACPGMASTKYPCDMCKGTHFIVMCPKFRELSVADRHRFVIAQRLCFNCFGHHNLAKCGSKGSCRTCNEKHHTMIHLPSSARTAPATTTTAQPAAQRVNVNDVRPSAQSSSSNPAQPGTTHPENRTGVLLATCVAALITNLHVHPVRVLVDPGSQLTFISENIVSAYQLPRQRSSIPISGVGGSENVRTRGLVTVQLRSTHSNEQLTLEAHVLKTLTGSLPTFNTENVVWPELELLPLADPEYLRPRAVDMIIGADHYGSILRTGVKRQRNASLIALSSIFGWMVLGPLDPSSSSAHVCHATIDPTNDEIQASLTKFWVQEEVSSSSDDQLTPEEQDCEEHFASTHSRDEKGRYVVRIPLKSSITELGESRFAAQRCLQRVLNRVAKGDAYGSMYSDFLREYEELGHMRRAPNGSSGSTIYYLPHHGVLREDRVTTKLRVVFNGSCPTSNGVTLNDLQHIGPKLQRDISDVLLWIRQRKYLFATDITKMFRQIQVHKKDWDLQRILWVDDQNNTIEYQLTTVTYGTRSAPYLSVRVLLQLVQDEGHRFPLAVDPVLKGRYVDDIFGGSDQEDQLTEIATQVEQLCLAGGFPLAKWHSNSNQLEQASENGSADTERPLEDSSTKILGMSWVPRRDVFQFSAKPLNKTNRITKRIILSETAQLYDPLGYVAPLIIRAKVLLQELWLEKLGWDEQVSAQIACRWTQFREELQEVHAIEIPRWLGISDKSTLEIHGFSDASQLAMAAVTYLRVTDSDGKVSVSLIGSKTKVAPLKRLTIPRLELSAALLLAKLINYVQRTLGLTDVPVYMWTDSSVTHAWVKSHPSRWKEFVRNRVTAIQELAPNGIWRHVPGKDNPADCASRGLIIDQLQHHALWWTGPPWLLKDQHDWPAPKSQDSTQTHLEERPGLSLVIATAQAEYHWGMILKYSTLIRLLRITAICHRVGRRIRKLPNWSLCNPLSPQDLEEAKLFWLKATQAAYFAQEIKVLGTSRLPHSHPFSRLTAYIDVQGVIRVGGRLANAQLEHEAAHPAILPRDSHFTTLVIRDAHRRSLHGGTQLTLALIRQSFWILGGRGSVKSHIFHCITCARHRGERAQQLMGQLPSSWVLPCRPFYTTGVDYAGPVLLRTWKGRGAKQQKGWLCIFVCFVTSAVHLEVVSDYTAEGFIAAFRRFTGRRGICRTLHSDCGTTFVGADAQLKALFAHSNEEFRNLQSSLANDGTEWVFNPPAAPHMGGKWEAAVKSVKYHLTRITKDTALTFEEMTTLLVQIEAILNSRPLEPLSDDPEDLKPLTPAHFMVGSPLNIVPEPSLIDIKETQLTRWQLLQQRLQRFWKQWSSQHLQRYLATSKWRHPSNEIKVGSLVLLTDERTPPGKWPLARVQQLHPGQDGLTRVVTIRTATTTLVRPIAKLAILPISPDGISNAVADGPRNVAERG